MSLDQLRPNETAFRCDVWQVYVVAYDAQLFRRFQKEFADAAAAEGRHMLT